MKKKLLALTLSLLPLIGNAAGVPTSFTYQGKALNAAGTAPLTSTVSFTLSITDPSSDCILYQETQANVNLATTNGIFALQVGSSVGATKRVAGVDPGLSMTTVFANSGTQLVSSNGSCPGYTPAANDVRKLHVVITPSSGSAITVSPDLTINSVPNAMVAETLQGYTPQILTPVGTMISYTGATCPSGYVAANGASVSSTTYPNLASAYISGSNYLWGGTVASGFFTLPNASGVFVRGVGSQTVGGVTYTGTQGSTQPDQMQGHEHGTNSRYQASPWNNAAGVQGTDGTGSLVNSLTTGPVSDSINGTPRIGPETRPANIAVSYCIKY
jgi:hypothetical protein